MTKIINNWNLADVPWTYSLHTTLGHTTCLSSFSDYYLRNDASGMEEEFSFTIRPRQTRRIRPEVVSNFDFADHSRTFVIEHPSNTVDLWICNLTMHDTVGQKYFSHSIKISIFWNGFINHPHSFTKEKTIIYLEMKIIYSIQCNSIYLFSCHYILQHHIYSIILHNFQEFSCS